MVLRSLLFSFSGFGAIELPVLMMGIVVTIGSGMSGWECCNRCNYSAIFYHGAVKLYYFVAWFWVFVFPVVSCNY